MEFLNRLHDRNELLFYFGVFNFLLALIFIVLSRVHQVEVSGVNAWFKPIKFALSIGILAWTMGWYMAYLPNTKVVDIYSWCYLILMGFEIVYIGYQAGRGEASHFNVSTPLYSFLYGMMGFSAAFVAAFTAYIGVLFFVNTFPDLPDYYIWAIRLGIIIFVIFAFEGFVMGSRMQHTIGATDGEEGLPFLNWSKKFGDARIAHFIGMHALQVLPILAFYVLKNTKLTIVLAIGYAALAVFTLLRALQARPLFGF